MHEAPIAQALLDAAIASVPTPGDIITRLTVAAGPFCGVDPECLRFYFAELCKGTPAAGAELVLIDAPAKLLCDACGNTDSCQTASSIQFICTRCGGNNRIEGGNDLFLDSIEVTHD